ncbi:MAG: hypothetical protein ACLSUP_02640 [Blautia massiliensis (ex Durand et al. 2017)]|uniref:hypothetical protein n=1 Tax=Blautia massiliensis (ex Durand et al. 2017) TaxID=1737424 RepID=UPI003992DB24
MGLEDVLTDVFGYADEMAYERAVRFIEGLVYPGVITTEEAERIVKKIDEIEDMEG